MRRARLVVGLVALLALGLTLSACGGKSASGGSGGGSANANASSGGGSSSGGSKDSLPAVIQIGATSEKTGPVPVLGGEAKGYQAAANWINSHGGIAGHKVQVTIQDNAGDPSKAVSQVRSYAQQGIKLVVGGAFGPDCAAEAPVVAQSDLIDFCGSTDNLPGSAAPQHMFGVGLGYTPTIEGTTAMIAKVSKKAAVYADKDKSGDDTAEFGPLDLKKLGVKTILIRTDPTATSYKPVIQQAMSQGADTLWFSQCTPAAISSVGDAKSLGFKGHIVLENCLASFGVAQALKGLATTPKQILIQVPSMLLPHDEEGQPGETAAIETFKKAVPGPPDVVVGSGWDAMMMIKQLLEQTKTLDVATNEKALENNFHFVGVWHGGTMTASDHRGATRPGYAVEAYFTSKGTFEPLG